MKSIIQILTCLLTAFFAAPALAYIGPGSGISLLGGIWTVLVGFVLVLGAILFWPIRYMIKRMRARKNSGQSTSVNDQSSTSSAPDDGRE